MAGAAVFVDLWAFLGGVWGKCDFLDGFFVVKLWWFCGENVVPGWVRF